MQREQVEELTPQQRAKIKKSDYVFPAREAYPIDTAKRARYALIMARWPENKKDFKAVFAAVKKRYPRVADGFMGGRFDKGKGKPKQEAVTFGDDPVLRERIESIRALVAEADTMSGEPEPGSVASMFAEMSEKKG